MARCDVSVLYRSLPQSGLARAARLHGAAECRSRRGARRKTASPAKKGVRAVSIGGGQCLGGRSGYRGHGGCRRRPARRRASRIGDARSERLSASIHSKMQGREVEARNSMAEDSPPITAGARRLAKGGAGIQFDQTVAVGPDPGARRWSPGRRARCARHVGGDTSRRLSRGDHEGSPAGVARHVIPPPCADGRSHRAHADPYAAPSPIAASMRVQVMQVSPRPDPPARRNWGGRGWPDGPGTRVRHGVGEGCHRRPNTAACTIAGISASARAPAPTRHQIDARRHAGARR